MKLVTIIVLIFHSVILLYSTILFSTERPMYTDDWGGRFETDLTKEEILKKFNLYGGDWWNYYARGRRLSQGGFWNKAILDYKIALKS